MIARMFRAGVGLAVVSTLMVASPRAQSPADYQALRREVDLLRERLTLLQKEVDTLKVERPTVAVSPLPVPAAGDVVLNLAKAPIRGAESARVAMVEVGDFECPFCGRYFAQTAPQILKNYVETGKIRYAFVQMPLAAHRFAFKAGEAAACAADQGKFWEMHDRLFSNQGVLAPQYLPDKANGLVADTATYKTCLESSTHASDIRADQAIAEAAGVRATPTFFIGTLDPKTKLLKNARKIVGAKAYGVFQEALDEVLKTSAPAASSK